MYRAFILFFVVLFGTSSRETIGQVTSRPANETTTEAKRLVQEGIELTGAGQLPQAVRALEEAVKLDPHSADAYSALGRAYFKMREWRMAVDNLHRASALNAKQRQEQKTAVPRDSVPVRTELVRAEPVKLEPVKTELVKPQLPEEKPDAVSQAHPVAATLPNVINALDLTQLTALEIPLPEKPAEKQEPIGVSVSLSEAPPPSPTEVNPVSPIPIKPSNEDVSLTKIYRVGPGDVLDVRTNEAQAGQSTLFTITPAGQLEHPLLAEPLNVSALTPEEIQTRIQDDLKKRALSENPVVAVGVRDYASHTILVSGLVKDSGTKILRREAIPLYVVVADAQPLPEAARVTVVRNELSQMFEIDLTDVVEMNLLVRPGDVVNLLANETQFIYVGGEVKAPGEKIFRRGLTLTQAIISAGGVTKKSKVAEIGRDDGQGFLLKTNFKLKDIQTGKTMDPLIKPGDRIMILR
ncbi:MAG TPA: polysaccharide biosynthesis/export family protein [Pyrinomonadaceae bacterium]|nr:polysaccharide biosynthesis/export family protein [Pyrinomonadaceae bacterium]